jgi:hypothetical protein
MEQVQQPNRRSSGRGALGWAAFLLIAMLATAAVIAGAIRTHLSPSGPAGTVPTLSAPPSPAPPPLPKPGGAPPSTDRAAP